MTWIDRFWKFSAQTNYSIGMLLCYYWDQLCMLPGLIYNTCQLELAGAKKSKPVLKTETC